MKYLLSGKLGYSICDFENQLSSKWQRSKTAALTASLVPMDKYWPVARAQPTTADLERHLSQYYTIIERLYDKPQPYEFW